MPKQPFYLPTLADINAKPSIIRGGLPLASGATVAGQVEAGTSAPWFASEPLINLGTRACYHFSDPYCYSGGSSPALGTAIASDLANGNNVCSTTKGPMIYGNGGFLFTATNATNGTSDPEPQGIIFTGTDLFPTAEVSNHFVNSIWIATPSGAPTGSVNTLLFTYPDGSTWSIVNGVFTFTPVGQAAIPVPNASITGGVTTTKPLQFGYSIDAATDGSSQYSVSVYTNGQKVSTTNYATAYTPASPAPSVVGFSPDATNPAALFAYTALRVYVENTTVSGNNPAVVIAADWLFNQNDLVEELSANQLPEIAAPPSPAPAPTPSPAPAPSPAADGTTASFTDVASGLDYTFTDTSTPGTGFTISSWSWDFGDGSPADTTQNPTHSYTHDGTYVVTLTVIDSNAQTATYSVALDVVATVPVAAPASDGTVANFTMATNRRQVAFTDTSVPGSTFTITGWSWNFGDGSAASTTQNPSYTYAAQGRYVVTLTVTDSNAQTASVSYAVVVE